jgi:23S rRNA (guanosine2251-2'-O)-methyltransferase
MINRKLSMQELGRKTTEEYKDALKHPIIIVLDNIRSLHNIGSVFRTADAFLLESIYLCGICATPPHNEIHKSALGAENSVPWKYYTQTSDAINDLKNSGYIPIAIEQTAKSISIEKFTPETNQKYALIFGNEVRGVQQEIINTCNTSIEIPQFGTKHSFNISVSAGIVLWEFYRKLVLQN